MNSIFENSCSIPDNSCYKTRKRLALWVSRFSLQRYEKEIYYSMKSVTKTTHPATHFVAFHDRVAIVANVA